MLWNFNVAEGELKQTVTDKTSVVLFNAALKETAGISDMEKFGKALDIPENLLEEINNRKFHGRLFMLVHWITNNKDASLRNLANRLFHNGFEAQGASIISGFKSKW